MLRKDTPTIADSPWPFRAALAVVLCTFPVIWVGGLVTTTKAGMAVPDWPGTFGYNLFLYPWSTWISGPWDLFAEHGHRLAASLCGVLTIWLVIVAWRCRTTTGFRLASLALLGGVVAQGVLGGMRVLLNERLLAMLHGTTGPLFFAATVMVFAATTHAWQSRERTTTRGYARFMVLLFAVTYLQVGVGAWLRHMPIESSHRAFTHAATVHVSMAGILVVSIVLQFVWGRQQSAAVRAACRWPLVLVGIQVILGMLTWLARYQLPAFLSDWGLQSRGAIVADGMYQTNLVTAHQATGSLVLASVAWTMAMALRTGIPKLAPQAAPTIKSATTKPATAKPSKHNAKVSGVKR